LICITVQMLYSRLGGMAVMPHRTHGEGMVHLADTPRLQAAASETGIPAELPPALQGGRHHRREGRPVDRTVKVAPRVEMQVARRLRLAASVGARSMSAVVNAVLDEALPSLEEIRAQLAGPMGEGSGDGDSR
jgi:hypothetical protein